MTITEFKEEREEAGEMLKEILRCENAMGPEVDLEKIFYFKLKEINRGVKGEEMLVMYNNFCVAIMHEIAQALSYRDHFFWIEHLEEHTKHCLQKAIN